MEDPILRMDFDVTQLFDLLESNREEVVEEIRALINENLNNTKEVWLVGGLWEYYVSSGSVRCTEILCGISREPHDKFLIDKMLEGIRSPSKEVRKSSLTFLGHVVSKQPSWLYKITQHSLFKELNRLLKTETDVVALMTGLLTVIMIIPAIPIYVTPYMNEIFDVFGRLATWTHAAHNIPKEHLLHLQVGLYSLFHRLYAMYPCNFLSYLRHNFSSTDKRVVFLHTIMPMLAKVKMHPALVTATKEGEMNPNRWRSKEYHEVIAECAKISLDVYESSFPEEVTPTFSRLNSDNPSEGKEGRGSTISSIDGRWESGWVSEAILKLPPSSLIAQAMRTPDLTSLTQYIEEGTPTAPPTPLSTTSTTTRGASFSGGHPPPAKTTTSPPETAMEATPENTPIKDRDRVHFKLPPTSPAAVHLNFGGGGGGGGKGTPNNSTPSSPLPVISSTTTSLEFPILTRRDSIFDSSAFRRDSILLQRLQKVQQDQVEPVLVGLSSDTPSSTAPPTGGGVRWEGTSSRRGSVPSPLTILDGHDSYSTPPATDFLSDRSGPLTPLPSSANNNQGQGLLDPDLSLISLEEESVDCQPSSCPKGGLHMADHRQMMAFAKRVSRLRFHSQCGPSVSELNCSVSPGTSPSSTSSTLPGFPNKGRLIKRSFSCPNITTGVINEEDEMDGPSPPICPTKKKGLVKPSDVAAPNTLKSSSPVVPTSTEEGVVVVGNVERVDPYEHLFQKILPDVLSPPVESRTLPSPHLLLDLCLSKAADLHNARSKVDEVALLRGHVELLHGQLLFERHRREAHALRNRRLAGKCRKIQTLEEHNNSLRREMHSMETEVVRLKKEISVQCGLGVAKKEELQAIIHDQETKLEGYRRQLSELREDKIQLEGRYGRLRDEVNGIQKEADQKKAELFSKENEIKHLLRCLDSNQELRAAYEISQKEILLLGELLRRHQECTGPLREVTGKYFKEEMEDLRLTCEDEIRGLRNVLESKMSQCEVAHGMVNDLEKKLEKREAIIMEQNKNLEEATAEYQAQIENCERKYESIKEANHRLELEILNLQHQLTIKSVSGMGRGGRGRMTSSPSNGEMSPAGASNHSDVDSAASAAGYQLSPDGNPCFFQLDLLPPEEMVDLQLVLDEPSGHVGGARPTHHTPPSRPNNSRTQQD